VDELLHTLVFAPRMVAITLVLCIIVEFASPMTRYSIADRFPGTLFIFALPIFSALAIPPLGAAWASLGIEPIADISGWHPLLLFFVALFVRDLLNYWQHRFDHFAIWPVHAVHHSQTELHAANGFGHPLQAFTEFGLITLPLSFVHFGNMNWPIAATILISFQSQVIHSPIRVHMGPLRRIFVDSRFHRIHHSMEQRHFNRNFGTVFTFWDQLFRTAYFPKTDEWPEVGVEGMPPPRTIGQYLVAPLRNITAREPERSVPIQRAPSFWSRYGLR